MPSAEPGERGERNRPEALWTLAQVLSLNDSMQPATVEWAYGNLAELYLLGLLIPPILAQYGAPELKTRAVQSARSLVTHAGRSSFAVYSTRRQILRYLDWYSEMASLDAAFVHTAEEVFAEFPDPGGQDWQDDLVAPAD